MSNNTLEKRVATVEARLNRLYHAAYAKLVRRGNIRKNVIKRAALFIRRTAHLEKALAGGVMYRIAKLINGVEKGRIIVTLNKQQYMLLLFLLRRSVIVDKMVRQYRYNSHEKGVGYGKSNGGVVSRRNKKEKVPVLPR